MNEANSRRRQAIENALAWPMFVLALVFLVLIAALTRVAPDLEQGHPKAGTFTVLTCLAVLWPVFVVEGLVRFFLRLPGQRGGSVLTYCLITGLIPPLRLATRSSTRPNHIWLPRLGWQEMNFDLQMTLENFFGVPMLVMALLILPILAVHYFWAKQVEAYEWLRFALDISTSLIWIGFTIEFIIRISASQKRVAYAASHWVDLVIVILPTIELLPFLRVLRVTQVVRLKALAPILNYYVSYYRLYGVAGKGWRAFVVLGVLYRLVSGSKDARIARLRNGLKAKLREARDLQQEIDYYRRKLAEARQK